MDYRTYAEELQGLLRLKSHPLAIAFCPSPPPGVPRVNRPAASGCTYWRLAAEGAVFYTEGADHFGCPVGAYAHGIPLPTAQAKELNGLIGTMTDLGYLTPEEIPQIPRRSQAFGVLVYAPLAVTPCPPDVVLVRGNARQVMALAEAARGAKVPSDAATMGRPACAMIPQAVQTGAGTTSLGCIGNRVYTGLRDDELYYAIPGEKLGPVIERLQAIIQANLTLEAYHTGRRDA
jgi:uncharacterized protein (DUF169 family)